MAITKFIYPPDQQGYSFQDGKETLQAELDGGASRFRRDVLNGAYKLNVSWTLDPNGYNYARAFYRGVTQSGALPFLIDLWTDVGDQLLEHEVHFVPGTFGLKSQRGQSFIVGATLEVQPYQLSDTTADIVYLVNEFGWDYATHIDKLDPIVNSDLPNDLPYPG
jgi:hypothetical protein